MIWLGIDTSNTPLAVALVKDGQVLANEVTNIKLNHSGGAMLAIERLLQRVNLTAQDIDAFAVSEGPGSYTGIRIGVTIAKTLAWTMKKPLVGVSSLKMLAANAAMYTGVVCTLIDARRQNVYAGAYDASKGFTNVIEDHHYSMADLIAQLDVLQQPVLFVGHDVDTFWDMIVETLGDRAVRAPYTLDLPDAAQLIYLAEKMPRLEGDAVHNFVPQYRRLAEAEANWIKEQKNK
ncbi:tRNA (adenosine(37)-N6)-threonylcarbamoyltransferase complex dimerization subunit type 1 TsaB [Kurthia massiliensis]|uniref:tRNA (adenosine(37)-N6)-threonylcarbamoyltransferase complex dimerization subunit type 1 TsaB n=1 Tax=Kurthia massiliensis TaxID=1033739 RepID=UPI000287B22D|nr:tRNA (adenosine(37)-N6)-threonylcarbamoyltransferase complex dimerization subunit type 1 TsaB [Kurthia massiliensis]